MTTQQNHTHHRRHAGGSFGKIFEDILNSGFGEALDSAFVSNRPPVNVLESDGTFELHVAAPGLRKEDFRIEMKNGLLHISAQKTEDEAAQPEFKSREFNYNGFSRSFRISEKVDADHISAKYDNGILKVTLPKRVKDSWNKEIKVD